jgi:hypothetical protein
MAEEP